MRPIAVWKRPKEIAALIKDVDRIILDITNNTPAIFGTPTEKTLLQVTDDNVKLNTAETIALTKVPGSVAARNIKLKIVVADMHDKLGWVQSLMDNAVDEVTAIGICKASGFGLKAKRVYIKPEMTVKQSSNSGDIKLGSKAGRADGKLVKTGYDWEYTMDVKLKQTWVELPSTVVAKTIATGMALGVPVIFRKRSTTSKGGTSIWFESKAITPE